MARQESDVTTDWDGLAVGERASEAEYRHLFEMAPDVIYSISAQDAIFTNLSPAFEQVTGWSVADWIGKSFTGLLHPEDLPLAIEKFQESLRGEISSPYELRILSKSGAYLVGEFRSRPQIENGKVVGKIGIARDITERKRAENALRFLAEASRVLASSLDYQTTLRNVARLAVPEIADWCVVDVVEQDGSVHRLATAHADPSKEALAHELRRRYPPAPDSEGGLLAVIRTGQPQFYPEITDEQVAASARDAEHRAMLLGLGIRSAMIVPLVARDRTFGAITLVSAESRRRYGPDDLSMAEDLAHDAGLAIDNSRLYQEAQEALRLREEFMSIASHELKTPLTALQLQIQILQRLLGADAFDARTKDRTMQAVDGAGRQVKRVSRLVADLLDVAKIAAGRLELEQERTDLSSAVRDVVARFQDALAAAGSHISVAADAPVVGCWDPFRVDQIVTNLVSNAIKYGDGKPIEVAVTADNATARLTVRDAGIGIPAEHLSGIFERFQRGPFLRNQGGLGLGLYICKQLAEAHGGKIDVTSQPGCGSTFTVTLPLEPS